MFGKRTDNLIKFNLIDDLIKFNGVDKIIWSFSNVNIIQINNTLKNKI